MKYTGNSRYDNSHIHFIHLHTLMRARVWVCEFENICLCVSLICLEPIQWQRDTFRKFGEIFFEHHTQRVPLTKGTLRRVSQAISHLFRPCATHAFVCFDLEKQASDVNRCISRDSCICSCFTTTLKEHCRLEFSVISIIRTVEECSQSTRRVATLNMLAKPCISLLSTFKRFFS